MPVALRFFFRLDAALPCLIPGRFRDLVPFCVLPVAIATSHNCCVFSVAGQSRMLHISLPMVQAPPNFIKPVTFYEAFALILAGVITLIVAIGIRHRYGPKAIALAAFLPVPGVALFAKQFDLHRGRCSVEGTRRLGNFAQPATPVACAAV